MAGVVKENEKNWCPKGGLKEQKDRYRSIHTKSYKLQKKKRSITWGV